jgi:peptide/nickel transport system permease protein
MAKAASLDIEEARSRKNILPVFRFLQNRKAALGVGIVLFFVITAILTPILRPGDPSDFVAQGNRPPTVQYPLGTMPFGEDALAQLMWGARTSLSIGFATGFVATIISVLIGMSAGYFRGLANDILSLLINIFLVMPGLPLAIILAAYLPPGPVTLVSVLSLTGWAWGARVLRSQVLSLREKDFVAAALVSGENHARIIFFEILPNMISLVIANIIGSTIYAIGAEVALEFLGLGNVSTASWGSILFWARNSTAMMRGAWWQFMPAGLCVALIGFALTLINNALDEVTNPRLRTETEITNVLRKYHIKQGRSTPVFKNHD